LKVGEITVAIDGTKVLANASRHSAVSYGRAGEQPRQVELEIAQLLPKAEADDAQPLQDGLSLEGELALRHERKARLQQACRSYCWPGANERPTARPTASTTAASLVLKLPLVRPIAWAVCPPAGLAASWWILMWEQSTLRISPYAPPPSSASRRAHNPDAHQRRNRV
jgi:hypothetical protein